MLELQKESMHNDVSATLLHAYHFPVRRVELSFADGSSAFVEYTQFNWPQ